MNIIVEGSDGVFKTTVSQKLSDKLKIPVQKGSSFETATGTQKVLFDFFNSKLNGEHKILDRFMYSNLVYASLYEGYTMINSKQHNLLEQKLKEDSVVIYLTAPVDTVVERIEKRGDEYIGANYEELDNISKNYTDVISKAVRNGVTVYTFDTSVLTSKEIVNQIIGLIGHKIDVEDSIFYCRECGKQTSKNYTKFNNSFCYACFTSIIEEMFKGFEKELPQTQFGKIELKNLLNKNNR